MEPSLAIEGLIPELMPEAPPEPVITTEMIDDILYTSTLSRGRLNGICTQICKDVVIDSMTYVNGRKHGKHRVYDKKGVRVKSVTYHKGKKHGLYKRWNDLGNKLTKTTYAKGIRHGLYRSWHSNGILSAVGEYLYDKPHTTLLNGKFISGMWTNWHTDGSLASRRVYNHGKLHGLSVQYQQNGSARYQTFIDDLEASRCVYAPSSGLVQQEP